MKRLQKAGTCLLVFLLMFAPPAVYGAANRLPPSVTADAVYVEAPSGLPRRVAHDEGALADSVLPESTVYFPIQDAQRAEDLQGWYVIAQWREGQELAQAPRMEYRMMYDETGERSLGYHYVVAVQVAGVQDMNEHRLRGTLCIARRRTEKVQVAFDIPVKHEDSMFASDSIICQSTDLLLSFPQDAGQMTLLFPDSVRFEVDAQGQGALNVGFSTLPFSDIQDRYPEARLLFYIWNYAPIFDRVGRLVIPARDGDYLYTLLPGGLSPCAAQYSPEEEAFFLDTRRLGIYVVSDRALGEPAGDISRPNPLTGAGDPL